MRKSISELWIQGQIDVQYRACYINFLQQSWNNNDNK